LFASQKQFNPFALLVFQVGAFLFTILTIDFDVNTLLTSSEDLDFLVIFLDFLDKPQHYAVQGVEGTLFREINLHTG
jgi:hypothetical protein